MKNRTIEAFLDIKDNKPVVKLNGGYSTTEELIKFLKDGVNSRKIKAKTPIMKDGYTNYKFKVYNDDGVLTCDFVVKVSHRQRHLHLDTMEQIKEIINNYNLIKKYNLAKIVACLSTSIMVLNIVGPVAVEGLGKVLAKDYEYQLSHNPKFFVSEENYEEQQREYYEELRKKAEAGDKDAKEKYEHYLLEESLKKQAEEQRQTFHGKR